jgi:hypothetical protein
MEVERGPLVVSAQRLETVGSLHGCASRPPRLPHPLDGTCEVAHPVTQDHSRRGWSGFGFGRHPDLWGYPIYLRAAGPTYVERPTEHATVEGASGGEVGNDHGQIRHVALEITVVKLTG